MNNFVFYLSFLQTLTVRGVSNKHCLLTFSFHLYGIFKKNEIKTAKRTPHPLSRNPGSAPDMTEKIVERNTKP